MSAFELPINDSYLHSLAQLAQSPALKPAPTRPLSRTAANGHLLLLPPPPSRTMSPASPSSDLISSTPAPVTRFLILAGPLVRATRTVVEVLLWRHGAGSNAGRRGNKGWSWAVVVGWWAVCLGGWEVVRFLLPPLLLFLYFLPSIPLPLIFTHKTSTPSASTSPAFTNSPARPAHKRKEPPTAQDLLTTVSDFSSIYSLLSQAWPDWLPSPDRRVDAFGRARVARGLAGVWVAWVVGGWVLGLRVMLGLIGTVALLSPSPYFHPLLNAANSSYTLRRLATFTSLIILGPAPSSTPTRDPATHNKLSWAWLQSKGDAASSTASADVKGRGRSTSIKEVWAGFTGSKTKADGERDEKDAEPTEWQEEPVQFRFELMENQRWWLGLDWTTTLAPSDRPVWCDTHLNPTPSASQFTLPPASTITLPLSPPSTTHHLQRTAIWHWLDPDWSIALHLPNQPHTTSFVPVKPSWGSPTATNSPLPPTQPMSPVGKMSLGEQALSRGLERLKAATSTTGSSLISSSSSSTSVAMSPSTSAEGTSAGAAGGGKTLFAMSQPADGATTGTAGSGGMATTMVMEVDDLDAGTDDGGWSYGGNKWEAMGPKGGLGKFTRRRRWTRLALLTEHVQVIPLSPPPSPPPSASQPTTNTSPIPIGLPPRRNSSTSVSPTRERHAAAPVAQVNGEAVEGGVAGGTGSGALRMRLKKAVDGH